PVARDRLPAQSVHLFGRTHPLRLLSAGRLAVARGRGRLYDRVPRRRGARLRSGAGHAHAPRGIGARGTPGRAMIKRILVAALVAVASACLAAGAEAADRLRVALQKTGTASWEIEVIKARGLDKAANLDIATTELASTEAGKIAIEGGSADLVVEDWLWAARERALGDSLLFTPYSTALGAV